MNEATVKERLLSAILDVFVSLLCWPLIFFLFHRFLFESEGWLGLAGATKIFDLLGIGFISYILIWTLIGSLEIIYGSSPGKRSRNLKIFGEVSGRSILLTRVKRFGIKYCWVIWLFLGYFISYPLEYVSSDYIVNHIYSFVYAGVLFVLVFLVMIAWFFCFRESRQTLYDEWSGTAVYKVSGGEKE